MPWRALKQLDFGDRVVQPGDLVPEKLADGVGLPDDPNYSSPWISEGYLAWVDGGKGKSRSSPRASEEETAEPEPGASGPSSESGSGSRPRKRTSRKKAAARKTTARGTRSRSSG